MFIRLFIKTTDLNKAKQISEEIISNLPSKNIVDINMDIKPYWKFDNLTESEIKLNLLDQLTKAETNQLLNKISNKWQFFDNNNEALSSETMENCHLNYPIEMIDIYFNGF